MDELNGWLLTDVLVETIGSENKMKRNKKRRERENTTSLLKGPGACTQTHCFEEGRAGRMGMGMLSQREKCLQGFQQVGCLRKVSAESTLIKRCLN